MRILSSKNCRCIVLVGMPGSGKTTVGRELAKRLGLRFADSDHEIEARTGVKIPTIFEIEGEDGFRKRETQTLDELTTESDLVLATGGGAVINPLNRTLLSERCAVVYLNVPPHILYETALQPYMAKQITSAQAMHEASKPIRTFMLRQARPKDAELFVAIAKIQTTSPDQLPLKVVIPGFIISELRTAFQMGFLLFVPFILIDLVVATVLMSTGMMMMPPATISMPLKILLFVLVDGWELVVRSLVLSFGG